MISTARNSLMRSSYAALSRGRNRLFMSVAQKQGFSDSGGTMNLRPPPSSSLQQPSSKHPNSNSSRFSTLAGPELSDLLARELSEEEANLVGMPEDLANLYNELSSKDWRIVDTQESGVVKMHSNLNKAVSLSFHCQDTLEGTDGDEEYDAAEEEEPAAAVRFTLAYSKAGKTLVLTCLADMGIPAIERVSITTQDNIDKIQMEGISEDLYQGPEFTELEEDVQDAFLAFVQNDCGVTDDVAAFIGMYADYKEQMEYMRWLKQVQTLVAE
jgi:complement component 1 Q subcomponent-binding protein